MKLEIIEEKQQWDKIIKIYNINEPYYSWKLHKIYQKHMNASRSIMLHVNQGEMHVTYPILIFEIPKKYTGGKEYKHVESIYGFTGYSMNGEKSFQKQAIDIITEWMNNNKIIAEFARISPFTTISENTLIEKDYIIEKNRIVPIYNAEKEASQREVNYTCNMSRRAQKLGIRIERVNKVDLHKFIDLYQNTMIINNAESFFNYGKEYFKELYEISESYFMGAWNGDKLEGGACFLICNKVAVYHLGCNSRNIPGTTDLLIRESLKRLYIEKKIQQVNLTGGRTTDSKDTLLKFKKRFSNSLHTFKIMKRIIHEDKYEEVVRLYQRLNAGAKIDRLLIWTKNERSNS